VRESWRFKVMPQTDSRLLYEQWVSDFAPQLYRFAYRMVGNHQVAEDLVQETFVEAWRSIDTQRQPGKARAWLFQILRFRYAHYLRDRKARIATAPLHDNAALARPEVPVMQALADREALQEALNQLAPEIRETFLLVFLQGYKCREAAAELHVPLGTVLSRLNRARLALRQTLEAPYRPHVPTAPAPGEPTRS
jgi:RNA polymerase sigma-70 factor, ECF subfamily